VLASSGLSFELPRVNAVVAILTEIAAVASLILVFYWGNNLLKTSAAITLCVLPIALFFTPFTVIDLYFGLTANKDLTSDMQPIERNNHYSLYQYIDDHGQTKILSEYKIFPGLKFSKVLAQYTL
jgi:hypothetical protein